MTCGQYREVVVVIIVVVVVVVVEVMVVVVIVLEMVAAVIPHYCVNNKQRTLFLEKGNVER